VIAPETLFERYREDGDLAAFGQLYDQLAPELVALAVRFAPSAAEAEDLVQESFLALLQRPGAFRRGARIAPFLVGILARQAGAARRRARRAVDPTRLDPCAVEPPDRASEARELEAELRAALERLPDPYREPLRQHLFEGRRPVEIAPRLGRTPGTVATQIQRGLGLLRSALPRGLAGAGLAALAPRGLAAVRVVVLARARELAVPSVAASSTLASIGALLASSRFTAVVLAIVLVGPALWLSIRVSDAPPMRAATADGGSTETPAGVEPGEPVPAQRTLAAAPPPGDPARIEPAGPAGGETLTVLVHVRGVAAHHLAELRVVAEPLGAGPVSAGVDAGGTARFELGPLTPDAGGAGGAVSFRAVHPMYLDGREFVRTPGSSRDAPFECELTAQPASVLTGRVRLPPGADPREVRFEFQQESDGAVLKIDDLLGGPCDEEGRFRIALGGVGLHRLIVTAPATLPVEAWCQLELLEELALPDLVPEPGTAEIHGRAELPPGAEARRSAKLTAVAKRRDLPAEPPRERLVVDRGNAGSIAELRGGPRPTIQSATLDERGHFALRGLEPGLWELELRGVAAEAVLPARVPCLVRAPASGILLWEDRCLLCIEVVDAGGPVAGAGVTWSWERGEYAGSRRTVTNGDGRVRVVADRTTDYALRVSAPGTGSRELRWSAAGRGAGDERRVELDAARASALELVLAAGSARLERVSMRLDPLAGEGVGRVVSAELADGRYRFARLDPGAYRASIGPANLSGVGAWFGEFVQPCEFELRLEPGATTEAEITLRAGGCVRVEIDTGEEPPPDLWLPLELLGPDGPRRFTGIARLTVGQGHGSYPGKTGALYLAGRNALAAALPPGAYRFRCADDGWTVGSPTFEVRAGETTTVELVARRR
jgi:RNA polymerase sigma-70 factor (ECF subfamily)